MTLRAVILVTAAFGATGSFAAQTPPGATPSSVVKAHDPNEVICERQEVLGSRLQAKRICMTRSQWADAKSQDRQDIERAQTQRGNIAPK